MITPLQEPLPLPADLASVEKRQTGLIQFLIVVIMSILTVILYLAYQSAGNAIPVLTLVALGACLYATAQERRLRRLHASLQASLLTKERVMDRMGTKLRAENAKTQDLGSRLDDLTQLYRAISAVNAVSDPDAAYDVVVKAAIRLVGADTGSLMLVEGAKALVLRSAIGLPDAILANHVSRKIGEGVSGWVAQNGESLLLEGEAEDDPRFIKTLSDTGIEYSLCVPLTYAHQVVGVLNLGISEPKPAQDLAQAEGEQPERTLGASHQSLANIFAQHAAVTVMNSRLLERIGREAESGD